jgi:hypothetical protein
MLGKDKIRYDMICSFPVGPPFTGLGGQWGEGKEHTLGTATPLYTGGTELFWDNKRTTK